MSNANKKRADRARKAILAFKLDKQNGHTPVGRIQSEDITDLLTDLRHFIATRKIDMTFDRMVAISNDHFTYETTNA